MFSRACVRFVVTKITRREDTPRCTCVLRFQMLDPSVLTDLEELTLCGYCKQKYNDVEQCPKYLSCKHYFCLRCIENTLLKGRDLFCVHCWKKTDLGDQGLDALPTHSALLALTNNLSRLNITTNNTSGKPVDKERKVTAGLRERDSFPSNLSISPTLLETFANNIARRNRREMPKCGKFVSDVTI